MREGESGWCYVGNGQLRYKDGDTWTDRYQDIDQPPVIEPLSTEASDPFVAKTPRDEARQRRSTRRLATAVCAGLLGLGAMDQVQGGTTVRDWASWANVQAGQISAMISHPTEPLKPVAAKVRRKTKPTAQPKPTTQPRVIVKASPKTPILTQIVVPTPPPEPIPAAAVIPVPKPAPTLNLGGYSTADYAERVGEIPIWVGYVRKDAAAGDELTTHTDFVGLGHRFEKVGVLPAPPKVDKAWWTSTTTTLATSSREAAREWAKGDHAAAMARLNAMVKQGNVLIAKVNASLGLHIAQASTSG